MFARQARTPTRAHEEAFPPRRFSGVHVDGWELQIFVERGREHEQPYWVAMTREARADGRPGKIGVQAFAG